MMTWLRGLHWGAAWAWDGWDYPDGQYARKWLFGANVVRPLDRRLTGGGVEFVRDWVLAIRGGAPWARQVRERIKRRLREAGADAGVFARFYVEDVEGLLKELRLAEDVRDACQRNGTSVVNFRRKVVQMLRAIGHRGIAEDIERERVPDEDGKGDHGR